jgi:hypothetical protein
MQALEDAPIDDEEAHNAVIELGVDVKALAARVRARILAADRDRGRLLPGPGAMGHEGRLPGGLPRAIDDDTE